MASSTVDGIENLMSHHVGRAASNMVVIIPSIVQNLVRSRLMHSRHGSMNTMKDSFEDFGSFRHNLYATGLFEITSTTTKNDFHTNIRSGELE